MSLYEIERALAEKGVDLTDVRIQPAVVYQDHVILVKKQGQSTLGFEMEAESQIRKYNNIKSNAA